MSFAWEGDFAVDLLQSLSLIMSKASFHYCQKYYIIKIVHNNTIGSTVLCRSNQVAVVTSTFCIETCTTIPNMCVNCCGESTSDVVFSVFVKRFDCV